MSLHGLLLSPLRITHRLLLGLPRSAMGSLLGLLLSLPHGLLLSLKPWKSHDVPLALESKVRA